MKNRLVHLLHILKVYFSKFNSSNSHCSIAVRRCTHEDCIETNNFMHWFFFISMINMWQLLLKIDLLWSVKLFQTDIPRHIVLFLCDVLQVRTTLVTKKADHTVFSFNNYLAFVAIDRITCCISSKWNSILYVWFQLFL